MGMCFLLYLVAYLAINIFIVLSSEVPFSEEDNLRALTSFLLALDTSLSKFITTPKFLRVSFTPTTPTQLYTQSHLSLHLENSSGSLIFAFLALHSTEFYLLEPPLLNTKYVSPHTLKVVFSPSNTGVRTAYLLVRTQDDFFVYYLQGVSEENKYRLKPVSTKLQGEIYGNLKIFNPENTALTARVHKSEGFEKDALELNMKNLSITTPGTSDLLLFKIKKKHLGRITGKIWVFLNDQLFFVPINGSRKTHKIDCGTELDLGILTFPKKVYQFDIKCEKDPSVQFSFKSISTSSGNSWVRPIRVQDSSEQFILGKLLIQAPDPGQYIETIQVDCENETFVIPFKYFVVSSIVHADFDAFFFFQNSDTTRKLCFENLLNHELWMREFFVNTEQVSVFPQSFFIEPHGRVCSDITTKQLDPGTYALNIDSNVGKLVFPIYSIDPYVNFFTYKEKRLTEIYGLLDLGNLGVNVSVEKTILIKNPTQSVFTLYTIQSIPNVTLKYLPNTLTPSHGSYEFSLTVKSDTPIYSPLKIATSIGLFYLTVYANILSGSVSVNPIIVHDLYPKSHKDENIVMQNFYPVPVKVYSITPHGELLSTSKEIIEVPAGGQSVIGKVTASVKLQEKTGVDFKKSLTYGDIKRWSVINQYEEGEKSYDIKILTDVAGEVKATVLMQVKKPALIVKQQSKGSSCLIRSYCEVNFSVTNPLDVQIKFQVFILPDNFSLTAQKPDCVTRKRFSDSLDEEFENLAPEQNSIPCDKSLFSDHEEIKTVKSVNENKLKLNPKPESVSFTEKLLKFITKAAQFSADVVEDVEKHTKSVQSLYLTEPLIFTLPPHSTKLIGPIVLNPHSQVSSSFPILLKNNYTILEQASVHMNVKVKKLLIMRKSNYNFNEKSYVLHRTSNIKESQKLQFDLSSEEISKFFVNSFSMYSPVIFKTFDLQNVGNVDIDVKGVFLDGMVCRSHGYEVNNCGEEFLIKPGEVFPIEVSYKLVESWSNNCFKLIVHADDEDFAFIIDTFIVEGLNINNFLYVWAEFYYFFNVSFSLALILITFRQSCAAKRKSYEIKTAKDLTVPVFQQYFCKKYSNPIMFTSHEEIIEPSEPILPIHENEPDPKPLKKVRKNLKANKNFTNVVQASDLEKKPSRVMPEIFATNKFLMDKSKKSKILHSRSMTSKNEIEEEDFFIDAYKKTNQLFAGYLDREPCSLVELTQDSDPIDTDPKFS